jgi:cell division protein FtsW (lipid II flippase)
MDTSSLKNLNILNEKNKNIIIGLITVFIIIWSLVYAIPDFINSLFHTFLGIIILLLTVILISSNNIVYGIITALIFFILYRSNGRLFPEKNNEF